MTLSRYGGTPTATRRLFSVHRFAVVLFDALHSFQGRGLRDATDLFVKGCGTFGNEELWDMNGLLMGYEWNKWILMGDPQTIYGFSY